MPGLTDLRTGRNTCIGTTSQKTPRLGAPGSGQARYHCLGCERRNCRCWQKALLLLMPLLGCRFQAQPDVGQAPQKCSLGPERSPRPVLSINHGRCCAPAGMDNASANGREGIPLFLPKLLPAALYSFPTDLPPTQAGRLDR